MTLKTIQSILWDTCQSHGFSDHSNIDQKLLLSIGELVEAQNELRDKHRVDEIYYAPGKPNKPEGFPIEVADAIIRLLNLLSAYHIDAEEVIMMKDRYNQSRPFMHGKVF